jgi:hypothetical protein
VGNAAKGGLDRANIRVRNGPSRLWCITERVVPGGPAFRRLVEGYHPDRVNDRCDTLSGVVIYSHVDK